MQQLPYPAEELRQSAFDAATNLDADLSRLVLFFRGHEKDTLPLDGIRYQISQALMRLRNLEWPDTRCSEFAPGTVTPRPPTLPTD